MTATGTVNGPMNGAATGSVPRELPVDCPAHFVGAKKEPPRYPPPSVSSSQSSLSSNRRTTKMSDSTADSDEALRIRRYEDDLRRRREDEARAREEEDFLRASLRGSKRLRALQENSTEMVELPSGIDNPTYTMEDMAAGMASKSSTLPIRQQRVAETPVQLLGPDELLSPLRCAESSLPVSRQADISSVVSLVKSAGFLRALHVYNKMVEVTLREPTPVPVRDDASSMCTSLLAEDVKLHDRLAAQQYAELQRLLQSPNIQNLLVAHDQIAEQRIAATKLSTTSESEREYLVERASQYGEDSIRIVRLQKTADPLGATVRNEGECVVVGRIVKGGVAERSGLLHEGDEIIEINGIDVRGKSINDVCDLMGSLTGTLTFLIVPAGQEHPADICGNGQNEWEVHMKALFDYDPEDDVYIPCRELGISFQKGDVLHIISQHDANWWQAYRDGEDDQALAGLIPSRSFQEQREAMRHSVGGEDKDRSRKKHRCHCGGRNRLRKKKKHMYNDTSDDLDAEEILIYEEVCLYNPQPSRKRPIVLIGPPNVGRQELRQRLMESCIDRFAPAIPHTSRQPKDVETDGKDYHFIARDVFESDIADHKFVEYGEFERNLYGTSVEAIRQVVNCGKICILNFYPQSLRALKASDLKPYIVFIAPPRLEKLKQLRQRLGLKFTDEDLKVIIEKAREMEENYIQYFDMIIVNSDLDKAYEELLEEINRLEVEPQWVPASWLS